MTLDEHHDNLLTRVESVGTNLAPDDDWMPMLFIVDQTDQGTIVPVPALFTDEEQKNKAYNSVIPKLLREQKAKVASLVTMTWMVVQSMDDSVVRPSEDARRVEAVNVASFDWTGAFRWAIAEVTRSRGEHPRLGHWKKASSEAGAKLEGIMSEPILAALRANRDAAVG